MYKSIRKKVASTFSEIEKSEDFAWGKWLKEPHLNEYTVEGFETSFIDTSIYNSWLEKPAYHKKTFGFKETFVFPEIKNLRPKKLKTNTVFFGLPKTELRKFKLFDREFKFEHQPQKVEFTDFGILVKDVEWEFPHIKIKLISWELKPIILKINLLTNNNLTVDKFSGKETKIEFKPIKAPLKIYKVKITNLDKIKLAKIYYLKNISLHDVRILRESLSLIDSPVIKKEELKYLLREEDLIPEVKQEEPDIVEPETVETEDSHESFEEITEKSIEQQMSELLTGNSPEEIPDNEDLAAEENEIPQSEEPGEKIEVPSEIIPEEKEEIKIDQPEEVKAEEPAAVEPEIPAEAELKKAPEPLEQETEEEEEEGKDSYGSEFESVYYFQQEGAEFLLDSKRALLHDEIGLGKSIQVIAALKNLFLNKKIKNAVIVCDSSETGSRGRIPGDADGWLGHLHQRAPELKAEAAGDTSQSRSRQWKNSPDVFVINYDAFVFDLEENVINIKDLKKNTCFIFDEVQYLLEHKNFDRQKSRSFNPKYLWVTSSNPESAVKEQLDNAFKDKLAVKHYLGRTRKEVENDLPPVTWQNKWLTLDDDQVKEYNEAFASAKEKVQWFLESGNPLRFNANVFTLIHQIKQVCNFSDKGKSRKTRLLLDQVKLIENNQQKVVIFSQYEKAGIKKIEEVLKKNNIKFLSYAPGLSTKEMDNVLKRFNSSPAVTALVVGVKPSRVKIPSGNIPYVIHFDLWWNPATLWQTEESINGSSKEDDKSSLNIYSYLTKNTIEEKIHSLLHKKGFLNKHIMETVNPDSISEMITNPEWLEIFDMPDEEYRQRYLKGILETEQRIDNYSLPEFIERGRNFFTKLGYKNLNTSENKDGDSFDIRGIFKKAKYDQQMCARFLLKDVITPEEVKSHLSELKEVAKKGKYFLITKGTFEGEEIFKSNESLIDKNQLTNYFYQFIII